ncbi:MAG: glutathione synthetase [Deltaproteobacteria bacterium]|nr:glutathione synthetase [Deltaproteobacteria bacterium]
MNICFVMYPWEKVMPETDSTLRLIHQSVLNGHNVALISSNNLTIRDCNAFGFCKLFLKTESTSSSIISFYKKAKFKDKLLPLGGFDVIFIRTNPPLDSWLLSFLDSVQDDTIIINSVTGLRKANSKIYTAGFDESIIPETHVSKNKDYLKRIIDESDSERMILKPLDGFGGQGVIIIEKSATDNINSLLDFYINARGTSHYVILQEYLDDAKNGDVRVLMLNGEPIGAMRRVPGLNEFRSNIHAGGTEMKHTLTKTEIKLCRSIGKKLVRDGLYFVGLDIIDNKLLEVNVCSPGGISRINKLNKTNLQKLVLQFAEDIVVQKEKNISHKISLRKKVDNA